jgi:hypothetical protein
MTSEQVKIFQAMSAVEKLKLAARFYLASLALKAASLGMLRPGSSEKEIQEKTKELFLYAAT